MFGCQAMGTKNRTWSLSTSVVVPRQDLRVESEEDPLSRVSRGTTKHCRADFKVRKARHRDAL